MFGPRLLLHACGFWIEWEAELMNTSTPTPVTAPTPTPVSVVRSSRSYSRAFRLIVAVAVMIGLAASVSACGRKGAPETPPGSKYPKEYPTQ